MGGSARAFTRDPPRPSSPKPQPAVPGSDRRLLGSVHQVLTEKLAASAPVYKNFRRLPPKYSEPNIATTPPLQRAAAAASHCCPTQQRHAVRKHRDKTSHRQRRRAIRGSSAVQLAPQPLGVLFFGQPPPPTSMLQPQPHGGFESIQMVYWFASGWDARDIPKAAQMLARSEEVRVIVCVGLRIAVGAHAKTVLEHLNSEKGLQFFFLKVQVQAGSLQMSGDQSNHTAYILARLQQHDELKYPVWPFPQTQQSVEVLFDDAKWHGGCVCAFNPRDSKGIIRCYDGEILEFDSGDPDISFLPRTDLQWLFGSSSFGSGSSRVLSPFSSNCTLCSSAVAHEEKIQCARCSVNIFHARCIGSSTMPMDLENFLCVFCRSDLADSGRRQIPCFFWDPANMFCAGCGYAIQGSDQNEFDYCKICNAVYGYCCSARTSAAKKCEFRCCG